MASILKVDAMQGVTSAGDITITSEGGAATQSLQQGLAKAWNRFTEESTTAIRDSFNVSGITDNGTGDTTTTYSNAMSNANYASSSMATWQGDSRGGCWLNYNWGNTNTGTRPTTTALRTKAYAGGTASLDPVAQDLDEASVIVHGDLA